MYCRSRETSKVNKKNGEQMISPFWQQNCQACKERLSLEENKLENIKGKFQAICPKCGAINNFIETKTEDGLVLLKSISIEK